MNGEIQEEEDDEDETVDWRQPTASYLSNIGGNGIYNDGPTQGPGLTQKVETQTNFIIPKTSAVKSNHGRCIIHIDFDCFYCQVELLRNPALQGRPFGVYQKHIIVTSNYVARDLGVKKMSTKAEALKVCPDMILINGEDLTLYREYSMKMFNLLKAVSPLVERIGLDENFIDVTKLIEERNINPVKEIKGHCYAYEGGIDMNIDELMEKENSLCDCGCLPRLAMASKIAAELRKSLYDSLGLASSAGIAHNKVLAKLIGKMHKPNQQTTILPSFAQEFLCCKNVREIPGIGSRSSKDLNKIDVETVNDLLRLSRDDLKRKFGINQGNFMADISLGIDNTSVHASEDMPKSASEEESFRKLSDFEEVKKQLTLLLKKLFKRLDRDGRFPRTIKLTLRKHCMENNYARVTRQINFDPKILKFNNEQEKIDMVLEILVGLFDKMIDRKKSFDLAVINVAFTNFDQVAPSSSGILRFFGNQHTKPIKAVISHSAVGTLDKTGFEKDSSCEDFLFRLSQCNDAVGESQNSSLKQLVKRTYDSIEATEPNESFNSPVNRRDHFSCFKSDGKTAGTLLSKATKGFPGPAESAASECGIFENSSFGRKHAEGVPEVCKNIFHDLAKESYDALNCPDGIDKEVFRQLPIELRTELIQDWKKKDNSLVNGGSATLPPKKKQKRTSTSGIKSIRNYFKK